VRGNSLDYPVNWGEKNTWFIFSGGITWGYGGIAIDESAENPIDAYKASGRKMLVELSSFGPSSEWMGRLLWINDSTT
jgi:hypothetical protein